MKSFSKKNIRIVDSFKNDLTSNILFQLKDENSRIYNFQTIGRKYLKSLKRENESRSQEMKKIIIKNRFRKRILKDVNYVFNESRKTIFNEKKYKSSKNIYNDFFPTQLQKPNNNKISFKKKMSEPKITKDNSDEEEYNNENLPKITHNQLIILKGKKNKTYRFKEFHNNDKYKNIKNIRKLDLTNFVPYIYKDSISKKLNEFIMMEKVNSSKKSAFKV
jgi:hypothetical protein